MPAAPDPGGDPAAPELRVHATCIALGQQAALLRGPPGAGKSDLALRCLWAGPGPLGGAPVRLVADDQVLLRRNGNRLIAAAPAAIKGKLEVRGLGIIDVGTTDRAEVVVLIDLTDRHGVERLPDPPRSEIILGISTPVLRLCAHDASAPLKVLLAIYTCGVAAMP